MKFCDDRFRGIRHFGLQGSVSVKQSIIVEKCVRNSVPSSVFTITDAETVLLQEIAECTRKREVWTILSRTNRGTCYFS